jgi:osmotically-inducible protein OsmY
MSTHVGADCSLVAPGVAHAARPEGPVELAEHRLRKSAYLALRGVSCAWDAGVLTLLGRVPSYYLKQVAQVTVAQVGGVERVENRLEVAAPHWPTALPA